MTCLNMPTGMSTCLESGIMLLLSHIDMQCHFVLRYELWYGMNSFKSLEKKYFLETNQDFLKCLTIFAIGNVNAFIEWG